MLEYASYCGNYYGTPRDKVEEKTAEGYTCPIPADAVPTIAD